MMGKADVAVSSESHTKYMNVKHLAAEFLNHKPGVTFSNW
jgi:hypothetical protein